MVFTATAPAYADVNSLSSSHTASERHAIGQVRPDTFTTTPGEPARGSVTYYRYDVINLKKTKNWTNTKKQLGACKVSKGVGGSCTISQGYSVGTDVSVSLGANVKDIAASVGFNIHYSANGSVSWTSPAISKKSSVTYKAYSIGTKATYQIRKMKGVKTLGQKKTRWTTVGTSGTLTAFSPNVGFDIKK
ncbi:hypothetical protein [Glutamicibacter sp. PS]|uniref:hypothetical protein n=1 Tax=Glutamicibacter sp. PS TaxID=3075634 RepID=UPI00284A8033|nr:hypothetical protein [Glutamicibacter sp. PS]MDR4534459.1 hypothetical protein [Glutamicibacter sp. PS]